MTSDAVPFPKPDASEAQENKPALVALHTPVNVRSISLAVIAVFAVVYMLKWGQAFFIPVMFGIMMSYTFGPIVDRLDKYRIPRAIGATIVLVAIVGGFGSAVYALRHEVAAIIETLPEVAQKFEREIAKRGQKETPLDKVQKAASEIEKVASDAPAASPAAHRGAASGLLLFALCFLLCASVPFLTIATHLSPL